VLAVRRLAELLRTEELKNLVGVACSVQVEEEARRLGIPLTTLEERPVIDLTMDGADEVDPNLDLIKGRGGALLREKIVAQASRREIIVVDDSKLSPCLGTRSAIPVEVITFGWRAQADYVQSLGASVTVREGDDGSPFKTDQGNLILDCQFGSILEPARLAAQLKERTGIVEHGLFLGLASEVIVAGSEGVRHLKRDSS
jgi:ribose 5-phosphate isomerase A